MFLVLFIILYDVALFDACFPTIAPDEYYPTATLPEYTTPIATTEMVTEKASISTTEMITSKITTEEMMEETTVGVVKKCDQCKTADIKTRVYTNEESLTFEEMPLEDGCKRTRLTCKREGVSTCRIVDALLEPYDPIVYETLPSLGDERYSTSFSTVLSCDDDGTYSGLETWITGGTKVKIEGIYCHFDQCE
ncbi:hypothetical protein CAEBREN_06455 [Caenorhabditis brenneri]|uniref:DUF281 domain-containing protein n=1 Tax=Caenorhabditis brenneri TaxID=135651 RepID=G0NIB4_CAEBE|nr:hypothetical protein CAEBREN_06455 [Caenorhabditis brenneri]